MRRDRTYPGVSKFKDRHGKWRWRTRAKGRQTVMLPGEYGSPEFIASWNAWANDLPIEIGKGHLAPGSIALLVADYLKSPEYKSLAEATQKTYRATLERFKEKNGAKHVSSMTPQGLTLHVRDKLEPHAWNMMLRALRHLSRWAVARGKLKSDPTAGLRKAKTKKTDGHHTWTDVEMDQFEARHPLGTMAHVAYSVLLCLGGQRRTDVTMLGRQHEREGGTSIQFRQHKTGKDLVLPILPTLRASIEACPTPRGNTVSMTYIKNAYGRQFTPAGFGNWFRDRCDEADLPHCSAHGLRKAAATRLADFGATTHQIAAVCGMSLQMAELYTRKVNQKRLAKQAAPMLVRGAKDEQNSGKPVTRFANAGANPLKRRE